MLLCLFGMISVTVMAQTGANVSVNNITGTPVASIPLHTVSIGQISVPVSLVYASRGVKVNALDGYMGIGWSLSAGGEITRELRGLPDDNPVADALRSGWYYNSNGTKVNNFSISNDGGTANCTDETADNNYLTNNFTDYSDTEPDIFHVNAPGLSCDLVFDAGHNIKVMPYKDIQVSYTIDLYNRIGTFTIINERGVRYMFQETESTSLTSVAVSVPSYHKRLFNQFSKGVSYYHSWKLSSITDVLGNSIKFVYGTAPRKNTTYTKLRLATGNGTSSEQFTFKTIRQFKCLATIATYIGFLKSSSIDLWYGNIIAQGNPAENIEQDGTNAPLLKYLTGMGQKISFSYFAPINPNTPNTHPRHYLGSVSMFRPDKFGVKSTSYKDIVKQFKLDYKGLSATNNTLSLPDSTSKAQDLWGYYNGAANTSLLPTLYINPSNTGLERYRTLAPGAASSSYTYQLSGADRTANASNIANGMLERINYMNGGSTTLVYEPNDFYDATAQAVIQGGGVRVKQITDYDGINTNHNQVTNYSYLNPSSGVSSGSLITMPAYAFTTPYTSTGTIEAKWAASSVRSETDLSATDNNVLYGYVRISSPGTGNVLYQYSTPAMNWDASASPDWQPTMAYSARVGCGTATFASNEKRAYPFAPDINYGFERGLPLSTIAYNEGGQKVTETTYSYNRSFSTPVIITGLKFEDNTTLARNYAKYSIFTTTSELPVQTTTKTYDLNDATRFQTNTVSYTYNGTGHKLPTSTQTTRSDGSVQTSYIKYVKDYTLAASSDSIANALYILQQSNQNLPVESYTQVTRGGVTRTTGAQLTKFNWSGNLANDCILPVQALALVSPLGMTNFQPSVINAGIFSHDSKYVVQQNNVSFNLSGTPLTYNNNRKQVFTNIEDENTFNPAARVAGASANEVGFIDFDYISTLGPAFNTDTAKVIGGHSGTYSKDLTGKNLTRTLSKSSQAASYLFSAWATSGTVTLTLTNSSNQAFTYTLPAVSGSDFTYRSMVVPVTNMSATFTATVTGNAKVDDVWLYPDYAQVSSFGYDAETQQKTSETNSNGISTYFDYEGRGRLSHVYDQDKNIVLKKSYVTKESYQYFTTPAISLPNPRNYNNQSMFADTSVNSFVNTLLNAEGLQYSWNFGDGTPVTISKEPTGLVAHRYMAPGTYNVSVTKTSPFYGTKSSSRSVTIIDSSEVQVPVSITNLSNGTGKITGFDFYKNGVLKYHIDVNLGPDGTPYSIQVPQGKYDLRIYVTGQVYNSSTGKGFRVIDFLLKPMSLGNDQFCVNYTGGSSIYYPGLELNGRTAMYLTVSTQVCAPTGGVE